MNTLTKMFAIAAGGALARISAPLHARQPTSHAAMKAVRLVALAAVLASISVPAALAQTKGDLARQATNPAAALIQLQFQDALVPENKGGLGYSNEGIIQPVYPFVLGPDHYFQAIVTRTTVPIVTTPKFPVVGRHTGLGDTEAKSRSWAWYSGSLGRNCRKDTPV